MVGKTWDGSLPQTFFFKFFIVGVWCIISKHTHSRSHLSFDSDIGIVVSAGLQLNSTLLRLNLLFSNIGASGATYSRELEQEIGTGYSKYSE
jgi:hypothetical protein